MKNKMIALLLILTTTYQINAQNHQNDKESSKNESGFRIVGIIGHTLVNNEGLDNVFVPS